MPKHSIASLPVGSNTRQTDFQILREWSDTSIIFFVSALIAASALIAGLWDSHNRYHLVAWLAFVIPAVGLRMWLFQTVKSALKATEQLNRWKTLLCCASTFSGLCWGILLPYVAYYGSLEELFAVTIVMVGISTSAVTTLYVDKSSLYGFQVAISLCMIIGYLLYDNGASFPLLLLIFFYTLFLIGNAHRMRSILVSTVAAWIQSDNTNVKLEKTILERDAAFEVRTEFLNSMSHELRTPLNAVIGFSELLIQAPPDTIDERHAHWAGQIRASGESMLEMVENLLAYSSLASNGEAVNLTSVDVAVVIENAINHLSKAELSLVKLVDSSAGKSTPKLRSNEPLLTKILSIYLKNACTYISEGSVVELDVEALNENRLRLLVKDEGFGIATQSQSRIFGEFDRMEHLGGPIAGAGLGLAMAEKMALQIDASLGFTSIQGEGSTFWVDVPILQERIQ